jgi:predicted RNA binding protein YcfA (HicA-like mRNA interferase family)
MSKAKPLQQCKSGEELVHEAARRGYYEKHRKGSHVTIESPTPGKTITIPVHGSEDLGHGLHARVIKWMLAVGFTCLAIGVVALLLTGCTPAYAKPVPTASSTPAAILPSQTPKASQSSTLVQAAPAICIVGNTDGEVLNIRKSASLQAPILGGLLPKTKVTILARVGDWYKIESGYISMKYCGR